MIRLSAFADEISPDLGEQIAVLQEEQIHFIDLRGAWNSNVLDLSDQQLHEVKQALETAGIGVAAIGSPIGKVPITGNFVEHMQRFERALYVAEYLGSPYVRIFSFYPPTLGEALHQDQHKSQESGNPLSGETEPGIDAYRADVLQRLAALTEKAAKAGITLVHENEKMIYGDTIARNVDLLQSVNHPRLRAVFDPANYLECQQVPYPQAYDAIKPWLEYVHVKDVNAQGTLVVAGEGEARWPDILQRLRSDGYDGFLSLEPHLAAAGQFQGFSGADRFRQASQALQRLLREINWEYA
ncbi:xylose isomerase [Ktedonobacter sp. SOSP1-52]|uniref:sugar phosphate isomerase/epimerase family protein n=1 Tax=Ktedonobacter sp. SOSP1-52 TaxID=2778366 RepID=UPI001915EEBE|nr:sugar phosphate isomerase/epimerase [Ktedonobacter sp. SOSP1-52]GHO64672.1 xylose isomerase [Ktedonobacter sp. SOSP1-52]